MSIGQQFHAWKTNIWTENYGAYAKKLILVRDTEIMYYFKENYNVFYHCQALNSVKNIVFFFAVL